MRCPTTSGTTPSSWHSSSRQQRTKSIAVRKRRRRWLNPRVCLADPHREFLYPEPNVSSCAPPPSLSYPHFTHQPNLSSHLCMLCWGCDFLLFLYLKAHCSKSSACPTGCSCRSSPRAYPASTVQCPAPTTQCPAHTTGSAGQESVGTFGPGLAEGKTSAKRKGDDNGWRRCGV